MKQLLIIGSTVADIVVKTPKIPKRTEDVNIISQAFSLGGCAYNVASAVKAMESPYLLFSPIGTGIYGDYVRNKLSGIEMNRAGINWDKPNGSCFCLVEPDGERTFLCEHGAEYKFKTEWFNELNPEEFQAAYVCGLEIEEPEAWVIIDFLEESGLPVYFAPGPRIVSIEKDKMDKLFSLKPVIHVNREEALGFTREKNLEAAAKRLVEMTENYVIITDGEKGCYYFDPQGGCEYEPGLKVEVVDTIGAGDYHIGTFMACRNLGMTICESMKKANQVSAKVVQNQGAVLK